MFGVLILMRGKELALLLDQPGQQVPLELQEQPAQRDLLGQLVVLQT